DFRRNNAGVQGNLRQDEGKFANLRQADASAESRVPRVTEETNNARPDDEFTKDDERDNQQDNSPAGNPCSRVNEHADGDKKEGDKGIADGKSLFGKLVRVIGVAQQESGEKCAESEREADRFRDGGYDKADSESEEQGNFLVARALDAIHESGNQFPSGKDDRNQ